MPDAAAAVPNRPILASRLNYLWWLDTDLVSHSIVIALNRSQSLRDSVLQSPHLLPMLCTHMTATAYGSLLPQLLTAAAAAGDSGTQCSTASSNHGGLDGRNSQGSSDCAKDSNSSSNGPGQGCSLQQQLQEMQDFTKAWDLARRQQLPASHDSLLQLVGGGSSRGILWLAVNSAAFLVPAHSKAHHKSLEDALSLRAYEYRLYTSTTAMLYAIVLRAQGSTMQQLHSQLTSAHSQQQPAQASTPHQQHNQDLPSSHSQSGCPTQLLVHFLIPTVLLHWAGLAHIPAKDRGTAVQSSMKGLATVIKTLKMLPG